VEEVKLSELDGKIKILILDRTFKEWRSWKAFSRLVGRQDDVGMRAYAALLDQGKSTSTRDLATLIDEPLTVVRKALTDLYELGIIGCERVAKGPITFDYWKVERPVLGLLRLVPKEYFGKDYPSSLLEKEAEE